MWVIWVSVRKAAFRILATVKHIQGPQLFSSFFAPRTRFFVTTFVPTYIRRPEKKCGLGWKFLSNFLPSPYPASRWCQYCKTVIIFAMPKMFIDEVIVRNLRNVSVYAVIWCVTRHRQCDQSGRILKVLGNKLSYKSSQRMCPILGVYFENIDFSYKQLLWLLLWQFLATLGLLFITTSGRTGYRQTQNTSYLMNEIAFSIQRYFHCIFFNLFSNETSTLFYFEESDFHFRRSLAGCLWHSKRPDLLDSNISKLNAIFSKIPFNMHRN